jgi:hypothetical protein
VENPRQTVTQGIFGYASKLRFPKLFLLTAGLFVATLIVPDPIPLADEILLGLLTLLLGSLRTHLKERLSTLDASSTPTSH